MEKQKNGTIAVITSVAGDKGRQSNYVYGSAKGAISIFLEGLRQRLQKSGVHVLTIKPGWINTPLTSSFKKKSQFFSLKLSLQTKGCFTPTGVLLVNVPLAGSTINSKARIIGTG